MKKYTKEYIEDLLYIIKYKGDCGTIPCYPEDCPVYNECMYHSTLDEKVELAKSKLKLIPQEQIFDYVL